MKKVFAIMAIAGTLVACNNSSDKKEETKTDTTKMENTTPAPDTTQKMAPDTTQKMAPDTTKKM